MTWLLAVFPPHLAKPKTGDSSRRVSFETASECFSHEAEHQRITDKQFSAINEHLSHILRLQATNAEQIGYVQARQAQTETTANTLVTDLRKVVSSIQTSQTV